MVNTSIKRPYFHSISTEEDYPPETRWYNLWHDSNPLSGSCFPLVAHSPRCGVLHRYLWSSGGSRAPIKDRISRREKAVWSAVLIFFAVLELRTIHYDGIEHDAVVNHDRCVQLDSFQKIADGIKKELDNTGQILDIEKQGRSPSISSTDKKALITKWGQVSKLQTKAVDGAVATPENPPQIQQGKRSVDAEALGLALKSGESSAATVINDSTNEAGNFANQLVVGLHFGGWQAGGNNIKIGDPGFFPDSLTVEVSANPASAEDHSIAEAKALITALKKQGVEATLRFTTLQFPPNFMRIKVAGQ